MRTLTSSPISWFASDPSSASSSRGRLKVATHTSIDRGALIPDEPPQQRREDELPNRRSQHGTDDPQRSAKRDDARDRSRRAYDVQECQRAEPLLDLQQRRGTVPQ